MPKINVKALRELAEKATPGPWFVFPRGENGMQHFGPPPHSIAFVIERQGQSPNDSKYLAALSPEVVISLLDVVEKADAVLEWDGYGTDPQRALADAMKPFWEE